MPTIDMYDHADPQRMVIPMLQAHLPYSIPLLRRIQHAGSHPSLTARILATFPEAGKEDADFDDCHSTEYNTLANAESSQPPWLIAHVDLFRGRYTQIYVYSSLERATVLHNSVSTLRAPAEALTQARAQLLALLSHVKAHLLPAYLSSLRLSSSTVNHNDHNDNDNNANIKTIPPPPPQAFLIGSLHTGLFALLLADPTNYATHHSIPGLRIHRYDNPPYVKYLFRETVFNNKKNNTVMDVVTRRDHLPNSTASKEEEETSHPLPRGYRFYSRGRTGVQTQHFDLVRSRTHIPRSRETLATMPGVAVYVDSDSDSIEGVDDDDDDDDAEEKPIAWAFLNVDGALATLYVEPAHRGNGLAGVLAREVMRKGMVEEGGLFASSSSSSSSGSATQQEVWGHVEVLATNTASRRVMEKIGGEAAWTNTWAVVEVEDAGFY